MINGKEEGLQRSTKESTNNNRPVGPCEVVCLKKKKSTVKEHISN